MFGIPSQHGFFFLPAGTVIRVPCGLYDHVALLGDGIFDGERSVLSFSSTTDGLAELGLSVFAAGKVVTVDGFLGTLSSEVVMDRARGAGRRQYSWTQFNCEHFVRYSHGLPLESPQLQRWTLWGGLLGAAACVAARA